jgi:Mur ligase middle domain
LSRFGENHTVLTDKYLQGIYSQIVVENVFEFLEKIHHWVLNQVKPVVIGVTGSVGKTTCVCMLEDLFSKHGKTLRVYSKRITPLSLFETIINQLTHEHLYVVMEYSMYYKHHINVLTKLLSPDVGIILNIENAHLEIDSIKSTDDIWNSKSELLKASNHRFVEKTCLDKLTASAVCVEGVVYFNWDHYHNNPIYSEQVPFIKSRLTYTQIGASLLALQAVKSNILLEDILTVYSSKPRENRLSKITLPQGVEAFFDGEVSSSCRLFAYGDSLYSQKTLILRDVEFYDQPLDVQQKQFRDAMVLFDQVYVYNNLNSKFLNFVSDNCPHAKWFDDLSKIELSDDVFVHWGAYWRLYKESPVF